MSTKHIPTERESAFLDTVEDIRHEREIINGLARSSMKRPPRTCSPSTPKMKWSNCEC